MFVGNGEKQSSMNRKQEGRIAIAECKCPTCRCLHYRMKSIFKESVVCDSCLEDWIQNGKAGRLQVGNKKEEIS
jgi:hypothetical protein